MRALKGLFAKGGIIGELMLFLWHRKLWWLIPIVTILVLFGLLTIFVGSTSIAPFIYSLF